MRAKKVPLTIRSTRALAHKAQPLTQLLTCSLLRAAGGPFCEHAEDVRKADERRN